MSDSEKLKTWEIGLAAFALAIVGTCLYLLNSPPPDIKGEERIYGEVHTIEGPKTDIGITEEYEVEIKTTADKK